MLTFQNPADAIDEPKTTRMEQRTKPHVKDKIRHAAALLGVDETTFVTAAALERAQATIAEHERTVLSADDRDAILAALDAPVEPTDALRRAMALHAARIGRGG